MLQAQGDLAAALESYKAALAVDARLTKSDPSNTVWQRFLSASHVEIGEVLQAQGNLPAALKSYRGGVGHQRAAGQIGPRRRRLAEPSRDFPHLDRWRAAEPRATSPPRTRAIKQRSLSQSAWPSPTPATVLATEPLSFAQPSRRCAAGPGQSPRCT